MNGPQVAWLPDGRLHLHHGPIDLIIDCFGAEAGYDAAIARFDTVLTELVAELPSLRAEAAPLTGRIACAMQAATRPFRPAFITPMAAVAGAVADEMIRVVAAAGAARAYVNNGGDIAVHLSPGQSLTAAMPGGRISLSADDPVRGIATSGWRGRSHSRGIADSVTVLARSAAMADAAATMIANRVNLPGHPAITRAPASSLFPDSDLGSRLVTTAVGPLTAAETTAALANGMAFADALAARGLIVAAALSLNGVQRLTDTTAFRLEEPEHA